MPSRIIPCRHRAEVAANPDFIISMIDGKPYKTLRRHLATNGMTPTEYRTRYNLQADAANGLDHILGPVERTQADRFETGAQALRHSHRQLVAVSENASGECHGGSAGLTNGLDLKTMCFEALKGRQRPVRPSSHHRAASELSCQNVQRDVLGRLNSATSCFSCRLPSWSCFTRLSSRRRGDYRERSSGSRKSAPNPSTLDLGHCRSRLRLLQREGNRLVREVVGGGEVCAMLPQLIVHLIVVALDARLITRRLDGPCRRA